MTDLFKINFKDEDVIKIQNKIKEFNWSKISSSKTWEMGTNPDKLKELCEYWTDKYDWFTDQDYLNSFNQMIDFLVMLLRAFFHILQDLNHYDKS